MNTEPEINMRAQDHRDHRFLIGFLAGSAIGAGLTMYFAPRAVSDLRKRALASAAALRDNATERYQQASARIGDAVDELAKKGQGVVDGACDAVASGAHAVAEGAHEVERSAHGVERFAVAAKRGRH
jgi:gas vesicle protein